MGRQTLLLCQAALVIVLVACNRSQNDAQGAIAEAYVPDSGSVGFDVEPLPSGDGSLELKATYTSEGKTAKFTIALAPAKTIEAKDSKDFPMKILIMVISSSRNLRKYSNCISESCRTSAASERSKSYLEAPIPLLCAGVKVKC